MGKNIYSLVLSEEVIRAIDARAHRMGTNRSALIDEILADYVSVSTAEGMVRRVLGDMSRLLADRGVLIPHWAPGGRSISLKSSLDYKYRPTVKYEVTLGRQGGAVGELSVTFRTQSVPLLAAMTDFFRLWCRVEEAVLPPALYRSIGYGLSDGRFVRTLHIPDGAEAVAETICAYVELMDRTMKAYLGGHLTPTDVGIEYESAKRRATFLL